MAQQNIRASQIQRSYLYPDHLEEYMNRFNIQTIRIKRHTVYDKRLSQLEPVFHILTQKDQPRGLLRALSLKTTVPYDTLYSWKRNLMKNDQWRPSHRHPNRKSLTTEAETVIKNHIVDNYISMSRYISVYLVAQIIRDFVKDNPHYLTDAPEKFKCSYHFVLSFLGRNQLSLRRYHIKRRTSVNDQIVASFLSDYQVIQAAFSGDLIINADETSWHLLNVGLRTVTNTGADGVCCAFAKAGPKQCLSVMAAITRSGKKLPLMVICKGTTERCERKITQCEHLQRAIKNEELIITHSQSGWTTESVALDYLEWLFHSYAHSNNFALLWDVYATHRTPRVKQYAEENHIPLLFIPAGQTGEWQPLDFRIFGSLKSRARAQFNRNNIIDQNGKELFIDWPKAITILLDCWKSIKPKEIISAWSNVDDGIEKFLNKAEDTESEDHDEEETDDYEIDEEII